MRKLLLLIVLLAISLTSWSQKKIRKLNKEELAKLTPEQRLAHDEDRKSKRGKKKISMEKKVHMAKKEDHKSRSIRKSKKKKSGTP